ncbi:ufm1-specific protease 2-like [Mytilus trossulus]|uniref:ufm1-specific protease 2-like n=1 Tax=Mytilus trossulus TaxID=6551 RepID=UPI00300792F6
MPRIIICHSSVAKQIQQISKEDKAVGLLLGYSGDDNLTVSACVHCVSNNVLAELEDIDTYLPGGVFIVGYFHHKSKDLLKKLSTQFSQLLILTLPDNLTNVLSEDNFNFWTAEDGKSSVTVNITDECVVNTSVIARNTCCIDVTVDIGDSEESWKKSLNKEIDRQYKIIKSGCIMYKLQQSNVLIGGNQPCGITKDSKCVDLYDLIEEDGGIFKRTRKKKDKHLETLQFTTFLKRSGTQPDTDIPPCAPVIYHNIVNTKSVDITLHIDTISTVTTDTTVSKLAVAMSTSVCRQLKAMTNCMMQHSKRGAFQTPQPYHFQPLGLNTFLTVTYPSKMSDDDLVEKRRDLHKKFCLNDDRPVFRRNNKHMFLEDLEKYGYLVNPHAGLSASGVKDGTPYIVQGLYSYHHYMQDRFDDNKWGCAYRSLQTLISWFRLQGYTEKPIPGHKEIQQALVDVGDKDPKFVGSRQWIGSMECSYVLDQLIGVTSKIMFVSAGADLSSKGRELAQHFTTQGTPIMIGGGVLAHTILGVDFNDVTGDLKFLILDPHFTGAEELKVIQDKGWCGWKGTDFWDQTAHYNLCMPQRPVCI